MTDTAQVLERRNLELHAEIRRLRGVLETQENETWSLKNELREITEALDDERINNTMTAEEVAREMRAEIERLRAERDRALDRIAAMAAELKGSVGARWINPNDKTQEQYLPWIGAPCLFAHEGVTYYGHHTGGSFQTGRGVAARFFPTWRSLWMPLPAAPKPEDV